MKLMYVLEPIHNHGNNFEWMLDSLGDFEKFDFLYNANKHAYKPLVFLRDLLEWNK